MQDRKVVQDTVRVLNTGLIDPGLWTDVRILCSASSSRIIPHQTYARCILHQSFAYAWHQLKLGVNQPLFP